MDVLIDRCFRMKKKEIVLSVQLLLCATLFVSSCESDSDEWDVQRESTIAAFRAKTDSIVDKETFLYFTDPHLLSYDNQFSEAIKYNFESSFSPVGELFNILPLNFCLCGGDWLNAGDTQEVAAEKLLYADSQMKQLFSGKYYKMFGNHDTNYQGLVSETDSTRGVFSRDFIDKTYFSETGSAYYTFDGRNTSFFILDSWLDWTLQMDDYRWEQLDWLSNQLKNNRCQHKVIGIHMYYNEGQTVPMSEVLMDICDAFNLRQTISVNGREYDFSESVGKVHLIISGHNHVDGLNYVGRDGEIPVVRTCAFMKDNTPNFDLCVLDYDTGYLHMIRVGTGENRKVKLAM